MTDKIELPMACFHGDDRADVADDRERVEELLEITADDRHYYVTNILYALDSWFKDRSFSLEYVHVDQWMAVGVSEFTYDESGQQPGKIIRCQCDAFEDGMARIFLYVYDNYERDE